MKQNLMTLAKHHLFFIFCLFGSVLLAASLSQAASNDAVKNEIKVPQGL